MLHLPVDAPQRGFIAVDLVLRIGDFRFDLQQVAYGLRLFQQFPQPCHFVPLGLKAERRVPVPHGHVRGAFTSAGDPPDAFRAMQELIQPGRRDPQPKFHPSLPLFHVPVLTHGLHIPAGPCRHLPHSLGIRVKRGGG